MPTEVVIDNNEYVILYKERYESLIEMQVYEKYEGELLSLDEAKARTLKRIEYLSRFK